jgi:hypothetical protein
MFCLFLCIYSQRFNKFYKKYFRYKLWTHIWTQNYSTYIIILYQFVGMWRSYLWHCFVRFGIPRIYHADAVRLQMRLTCNKHGLCCNMNLYWSMVLYIKIRTTYFTFILNLFSHKFQTISALMNSENSSLTYSHTLRISSSILIIATCTSNSGNA